MFESKLLRQEQGFTLVEVLVAILIAAMFVTVSMEMMAVSAVFRGRAQEFVEATAWIQQDLEDVKYEALSYEDGAKCNAVDPNNGYADSLRDRIVGSDKTGTYTEPLLKTSSRTGKKFNMRRTTTPSTAPYVLGVKYDVSPEVGGSSIAEFYTEVIPNAALQCP